MRSRNQEVRNNSIEKYHQNTRKTTSQDEDKRYRMLLKLKSNSIDFFHEINPNQYDFNFVEPFAELQEIDQAMSPLAYAAHHSFKEIIRTMLKNKFLDIDLETRYNKHTPLIVACMAANYEIVRSLLLANAEVNKPNIRNHTPLIVTIFRLIQDPDSYENKTVCLKIMDLLIKKNADVNWIIDKNKGYSLLHYLCSTKLKMNQIQKNLNSQIIQFLLEKGGDPNMKTLKDQTCFDLVKVHCNKQAILTILEKYSIQQEEKQKCQKKYSPISKDYFLLDHQLEKQTNQKKQE